MPDQTLFLLINREWTNAALDLFMASLSSWGVFMLPVLVLIAVLFVAGGFRARAAVLIIAASVGLADGAISSPLKKMIGRPRPHEVLAGARIVDLQKTKPRLLALFRSPKVKLSNPRPGVAKPGRSLPSSHTLDNFCAALMLAFFFRRWGWLWFIMAGLIGYSRIYTGAHWPSDVLISALLGVGLGLLFLGLAVLGWRKLLPKIAPRFHARHPILLS